MCCPSHLPTSPPLQYLLLPDGGEGVGLRPGQVLEIWTILQWGSVENLALLLIFCKRISLPARRTRIRLNTNASNFPHGSFTCTGFKLLCGSILIVHCLHICHCISEHWKRCGSGFRKPSVGLSLFLYWYWKQGGTSVQVSIIIKVEMFKIVFRWCSTCETGIR